MYRHTIWSLSLCAKYLTSRSLTCSVSMMHNVEYWNWSNSLPVSGPDTWTASMGPNVCHQSSWHDYTRSHITGCYKSCLFVKVQPECAYNLSLTDKLFGSNSDNITKAAWRGNVLQNGIASLHLSPFAQCSWPAVWNNLSHWSDHSG